MSKVLAWAPFRKPPDESQKPQSLTGPFVCPVGSLPTVNKPYQFLWMSEHVFQLRCQVIGVFQFEKDQILRTEVVQDLRGETVGNEGELKNKQDADAPRANARVEQAEARTEQAEARTEQAEARAEQAEARSEQAETRSEQAILSLSEIIGKAVGELSPFKDIEPNKADVGATSRARVCMFAMKTCYWKQITAKLPWSLSAMCIRRVTKKSFNATSATSRSANVRKIKYTNSMRNWSNVSSTARLNYKLQTRSCGRLKNDSGY
jgi:hypothetical protein